MKTREDTPHRAEQFSERLFSEMSLATKGAVLVAIITQSAPLRDSRLLY
jgi:hypothetical protein